MPSSHRLHGRPVFVDGSGRRRQRVVVAGAALGTALVTGLIVLIVGFLGAPASHVPGLPGADGPAGAPLSTSQPATAATGVPLSRPIRSASPSAAAPTATSPTAHRRSPSHPPRPTKTR